MNKLINVTDNVISSLSAERSSLGPMPYRYVPANSTCVLEIMPRFTVKFEQVAKS